MKQFFKNNILCFATVLAVAILFISCKDKYERVGEEAVRPIYPQGVAHNFEMTYTETPKEMGAQDSTSSRVMAVVSGRTAENFSNQRFKYYTFPDGIKVDFYDEKNQKSVITADYAIVYSQTNLIDLRGNVVIETHDAKKLETPQLFFDRKNNWIFTNEEFLHTDAREGSILHGKGMDFNKDFKYLKAHKTYGLTVIKEEEK